jgi:hypothetical protein
LLDKDNALAMRRLLVLTLAICRHSSRQPYRDLCAKGADNSLTSLCSTPRTSVSKWGLLRSHYSPLCQNILLINRPSIRTNIVLSQ